GHHATSPKGRVAYYSNFHIQDNPGFIEFVWDKSRPGPLPFDAIIDYFLDPGPDFHFVVLPIVRTGIHPVGKENIHDIRHGIDPDTGPRETGMPEGLRGYARFHQGGRRVRAGLIKTKPPAVSFIGRRVKEFYG